MNFDRMQYLSSRIAQATVRLETLHIAIYGPKDSDPRTAPAALGLEQVVAEMERNLDELHKALDPIEAALLSSPPTLSGSQAIR